MGDFNANLLKTDKEKGADILKSFKMMIDGIKLKDTFAMKNTNKISYKYIHTNGKSTIDRIFISKDFNSKRIVSCEHRIFPPSDHLAVILTLERESTQGIPSRSPYWKLNTSILKEESFNEVFVDWWKRSLPKQKHYITLNSWWEKVFKTGFHY